MIYTQMTNIQYHMLSKVELKFLKLFSSPEQVQKINEILNKKASDD